MKLEYFVHESGICESEKIGKGTRIWAFAHVLPGAQIGSECNICDHVFIENDVIIGNDVTIKCGVQVWDGVTIEDSVFLGPNVTLTNDLFPRSKVYPEKFSKTTIRAGASIGANATILSGIEIGRNAMIGAGSVVTKSIPDNAIVVGNPARIEGYIDTPKVEVRLESGNPGDPVQGREMSVSGVELVALPKAQDLRGSLSAGEINKHVPFEIKRYFLVYDVESKEVRGEHAHKKCHQFLVCIKGTCSVVVDDGKNREEVSLDRPELGLYLPAMIWGVQYKYSSDAVLLVLASDYYDSEDYIRDYQEFVGML